MKKKIVDVKFFQPAYSTLNAKDFVTIIPWRLKGSAVAHIIQHENGVETEGIPVNREDALRLAKELTRLANAPAGRN